MASDWPEFICHKRLRAAQITGIRDFGPPEARRREIYVDVGRGPEKFVPSSLDMAMRAQNGWWAIDYGNGYLSISPTREFEDSYSRVGVTTSDASVSRLRSIWRSIAGTQ